MDATSTARIKPASLQKTRRRRPRLPFKIADGYLFSEVAGATLRGLGWFGGLLLAFAVIAAVRRVVDNTITWAGMAELVVYSMPRIILFTLPMSVLYGTVQAFSDLSAKGEITSLWAGGMGLPRMLRAPLTWGVFLAVLAFWMQEAVVPGAEREKTNVAVRHAVQAMQVTTNISWIDKRDDNTIKRVVQAGSFDPKAKVLVSPRIQLFKEKGGLSVEILADRAVWLAASGQPGASPGVGSGQWKFYNCKVKTASPDTDETFIIQSYSDIVLNVDRSAPDPIMLGAKQTTLRDNLQKRNFEMVSIGDLQKYLRDLVRIRQTTNHAGIRAQNEQRILGAIFGIHDKIATPLIVVALVLIGVPLGIRPQRSGGGFAMGISLVVVLLYYVLWTWVSQIGKAGFYNPIILAYLPLAIILTIAVILVRKKS